MWPNVPLIESHEDRYRGKARRQGGGRGLLKYSGKRGDSLKQGVSGKDRKE